MVWKPNVTVAAVVEQEGKFLLVEEHTDQGIRLNQPAGHLEANESLVAAVVRETLEETAYRFTPHSLIGVYRWPHPTRPVTYLRFAFAGTVGERLGQELDSGILSARWYGLDEIRATASRHRSPLVRRCIEDHLSGKRYPLDMLVHYD
ncbi:MAG: NUDIX hydrolase [Betaproteobacteria bacterium]|nr:NUDIX hydrolase [Betaproteobacteria bacterium]